MSKMWKRLEKYSPYFISVKQPNESLFHISVTNYQKCWLSHISRNTFLYDLKEANVGIEFEDENELVERGLDMLSNPETLKKVSILKENNEELLTISVTKQYEIALKLEICLLESSSSFFFKEVIQPLLMTVCDLHSSQNELREALKKKDREIEEYKIEGRAPRRLITTIYDDQAHMKKHTAYEKIFGAIDVSDLFQSTTADNENNVKPQLKPSKCPSTASTTAQPSSTANGTSTQHVPKIEKFSPETVIDEIDSISPIQIDETFIPSSLIQPNMNVTNTKMETLSPVPKKRQKKKFNF